MRTVRTIVAEKGRGEEGAVAIMVALSLMSLLLVVALTLDYGRARLDRQVNKAAADSAVAAGMRGLDGGTGEVYSFRGVCEAVEYLRASNSSLVGIPLPSYCTDGSKDTVICDKANSATWARYDETIGDVEGDIGLIRVEVKLPYTADDLNDFPEESKTTLSGDQGDPDWGGCDQVGVIITHGREPDLGTLTDVENISSRVRSVGRVNVDTDSEVAVALLILEQKDCQALAISSGGAGGRIRVKGFEDRPGMIHVDSTGGPGGAMCGSKPIIEGKNPGTCPGDGNTCGGIVADEAEFGGLPGQISVFATANESDGVPQVHAGPWPPGTGPTFRPRLTRKLVDSRYLEPVRNAVTHTDTTTAFAAAASGAAPATYTEVGCDPASPITHARVFVKCANFNKADKKFTGTHIIFTGQVSAKNLQLPNAERVYIVGGTSPAGLDVTSLRMHDHDSAAQCASPAVGEHRAKLFVKIGEMKVAGTGSLKLCNTTVIMMGGQSDACLPAVRGTAPTLFPCGGLEGSGKLNFGGGAAIDWTAPNAVDGPASTTDWGDLEDLAAWSETAGEHSVGGGGFMHMAGVFMVPNANPFKINGGGAQDVENSQYIVRKLWNTGNGQLTMRPDPDDVITFPLLGGFELVR